MKSVTGMSHVHRLSVTTKNKSYLSVNLNPQSFDRQLRSSIFLKRFSFCTICHQMSQRKRHISFERPFFCCVTLSAYLHTKSSEIFVRGSEKREEKRHKVEEQTFWKIIEVNLMLETNRFCGDVKKSYLKYF